ncbi:hypothetical protein AgCh_009838 [Apium graveolens]
MKAWPVDRDLSLTFYYKTVVKPVKGTETIPKYKFDLKSFESVPPLLWKVENFIEVMGMVEAIGPSKLTSNGSRKTDVRLIDDREQNIIVTLWEEKATQFRRSLETVDGKAAFVIITGLLAKKYSLVVLSSGDRTTTYCNIDYAPLKGLKSAIIAATGYTEESLPPPKTPRLMLPTAENKKEMTIRQILETPAPTGEEIFQGMIAGTTTAAPNALVELRSMLTSSGADCATKP